MNITTSFGRVNTRAAQQLSHHAGLQRSETSLALQNTERMDSVQFKNVQFGSILNRNHGIHFPHSAKYTYGDSGQLQRALLIKVLEKKKAGDTSNIQLYLDSGSGGVPTAAGPLAMADSFRLIDTPVDVVIRTIGSIQALWPYLNATGNKIMYDRARIHLGPVKGSYSGKAKDANLKVRGYNEATRNLEYLIMKQAGIKVAPENRANVTADIFAAKQLNAIEALAYGNKGLVDAIIVSKENPSDEDMVLTRSVLNAYLKENDLHLKANNKEKQVFLRTYDSIDQVVAWARKNGKLKKASNVLKASTPQTPMNHWKSLFERTTVDKNALKIKMQRRNKKAEDFVLNPHVYLKDKEDILGHQIQGVPQETTGIMNRDTLFFYNRFTSDTPEEFIPHLWALNEKKTEHAKEGDVSNILIIENSPGGSSYVTEQIKAEINTLDFPVDVLVHGWGSSGGSKLVSMATGNRLMMPHAEILLHQTGGGSNTSSPELNAAAEGMNYSKNGYVDLIAKKTGRPLKEVKQDFKVDFWLNAVESLMYGKNGLIDAIVVGSDLAVTRENMVAFLTETLNITPKKLEKMAHEHYVDRRIGEDHKPLDLHDENNPFMNPLKTLDAMIENGFVTVMSSDQKLKASIGTGAEYQTLPMEYRTVIQKEQI